MRSSLLCRQPGKEGRGRNCFHLILYNKEKVDPEDMSKMYNNSQIEMVATWRGQDASKPHQHHGTDIEEVPIEPEEEMIYATARTPS